MDKKAEIYARLMNNVAVAANGCWLWTGAKDKNGYGRLRIGGRKIKGAHRVSWEHHSGADAGDKLVCHHCDTPACVNPDHLYLGTAKDNARDKIERGRGIFHSGENASNARISEQQAREIFALYATGDYRQKDIAAKLGVSQATVQLILSGKNWKNLGIKPVMGMRHASKKALRKLADAEVAQMVAEYSGGKVSQHQLARKFGVSQQYVSNAIRKAGASGG